MRHSTNRPEGRNHGAPRVFLTQMPNARTLILALATAALLALPGSRGGRDGLRRRR